MSFRDSLAIRLDALILSGMNLWTTQFEPHQIYWLRSVSQFLRHQKSSNIANVLQACGTGKTWEEVALLEASRQVKKSQENTLHAPDILIYTEDAIRSGIINTLEIQWTDFWLWEKWNKPLDRGVIVASIQTLQRVSWKINKLLSPDTPLIIWDEADLYITAQRSFFLNQFPNALKFWFSATGKWRDWRVIQDVWGDTIYTYSLAEAIENWVVVRPNFLLVESNIEMDALPKSSGDYPIELLDKLLTEAEVYHGIVSIYDSFVSSTQDKHIPTLVYVPSKNLVRQTAAAFRRKFWDSIQIRWWTWDDTSQAGMERDIQSFLSGGINVLIACDKWWRGMNLPNAKLLIDAYPTSSLTKIEQRHTRVMRRNRNSPDSKEECTIIQIIPKTPKLRPRIFPDIFHEWDTIKPNHIIQWWEKSALSNISPTIVNYSNVPIHQLEAIRRGLLFQEWHHSMKTITNLEAKWNEVLPLLWEFWDIEIEDEMWWTTELFSKIFEVSIGLVSKALNWKSGRFARKKNAVWRLSIVPIYPVSFFDGLFINRLKKNFEIETFDDHILIKWDKYYTQKCCAELLDVSASVIEWLREKYTVSSILALCKKNNRILTIN